ncbi:MAG: hypothetical protein HUJ56_08480, partial [Erysipelotrichaceae bacterium]|nr:hypothetical protein [Erysipelotrichaceae bacterium]
IYLLNTGLGTLFLIVGIIAMLVKGSEVKPLILELFGDVEQYIALIICVAECFIVSTNGVSAPSISLEGKTLWQLQVLPISKMQVLNAKLKLHVLVSAPAVVLFGIVTGNVLSLDGLSTALLILIPSILVIICGELGLVFNLLNPRLDYETESAAVKQSLSVLLTLFTGYALISVFIGLFVLVMDKWAVELYLGMVLGLEIIIGILLYQWLRTKGCKILETLG